LMADRAGLLKPARGFLETKLVVPIRSRFFQARRPELPPDFKNCQDCQTEILSLKSQIASLKEENLSAKKLLGAPLPANWQFSLARVISFGEDEIMISGLDPEGFRVGAVVIAEGIYLGEIESLISKIGRVQLVSSPEAKTVVKIISKKDLTLAGKGLLQGRGEGKMIIREILAEEEVGEGDLVVVPTEAVDLPVGEIISVSYHKGDVFKTAEVKSALYPRSLETVFLIRGKI